MTHAIKHAPSPHYFEELPQSTQETVRRLIQDAADNRGGPDGWKSGDDCFEQVECRRRDGFIPHSFNRGGLEYTNFSDLMGYLSSGHTPAHKGAAAEIERLIDDTLKPFGGSTETDEAMESLSDENATVMHSIRVMYHGCENGIHSASVSAAINTEAPYHRSRIAWAPGVFCEGAKEVEITWRTDSGLERKLKQALKAVCKEVF